MADVIGKKLPDLQPLKISCTRTDCDNDLHCYRKSKRNAKYEAGACQNCGAELVDWPRVKQRDLADIEHTLNALKTECIRHDFWHLVIDQRAVNHALRKGRRELEAATWKRVRQAIATKTSRDGRQTPFQGNVIYYAQHATASCCRRCVEYWHGIPPDLPLTNAEIEYFVRLCLRYIDERMPDLPEQGQKVPYIRKEKR